MPRRPNPESWTDLVHRLTVLRGVKGHESCYLAGPMTGLPDFNCHAFRKGASALRAAGFSVFNPVENDENHGVVMEGKNGFEHLSGMLEGFDLAQAMVWDLHKVLTTSCTFVLPGWENSDGAAHEVATALLVGKPVYTFLNQRQITKDKLGEGSGVPSPESGSALGLSPGTGQRASGEGEKRDSSSPTLSRHPNSARFHELVGEIAELHDRKQEDYGAGDDPFANVRASNEWGVQGWVGAMIRLSDKVRRLQSFARKGFLANEGAFDSLRDIAVYALIAHVLLEQELEE